MLKSCNSISGYLATRADDDWNAEEGGIEYKYALVAKYPDIELQDFNIPEGLQVIGKNHITIVSGKALKPVKKIVNGNKENLDELPHTQEYSEGRNCKLVPFLP